MPAARTSTSTPSGPGRGMGHGPLDDLENVDVAVLIELHCSRHGKRGDRLVRRAHALYHLVERNDELVFVRSRVLTVLLRYFHDDLIRITAEDRQQFVHEIVDRHRARIVRISTTEPRADVWRVDLLHLHGRTPQLKSLGHRIRMKGGLRGGIDGKNGNRYEPECRRGVGDCGLRPRLQMLNERRRQPDGSEQVGVDLIRDFAIIERARNIVPMHDASVVHQDVQLGVLRDQTLRDALDLPGVSYIELDRGHAGILGHHYIQLTQIKACDDDLIATSMERPGQTATDASATARDQNCVACKSHKKPPVVTRWPASHSPPVQPLKEA